MVDLRTVTRAGPFALLPFLFNRGLSKEGSSTSLEGDEGVVGSVATVLSMVMTQSSMNVKLALSVFCDEALKKIKSITSTCVNGSEAN